VIDFSSASYLGLRHATDQLRPWARLTTGKPAALGEPGSAASIAARLAGLIGLPAAMLATSTLHAFWDVFGVLDPARASILVDAGTYPIARWGVEHAQARGAIAATVAHHDPGSLRGRARAAAAVGRHPIVLADGFCPGCGNAAPVAAMLEEVRPMDGLVVLDDTQALGILGRRDAGAGYGRGGGGVLRWTGVVDRPELAANRLVLVASLAKAFGVPIAVVAGSERFVDRYLARAETRVHCSPPSVAHLAAAEHALDLNATEGDARRHRLAGHVAAFRAAGDERVSVAPGLFPMQTVMGAGATDLRDVHARLRAAGIGGVLHASRGHRGPALSLLLRADHERRDVLAAAQALVAATGPRHKVAMAAARPESVTG